jgi:hypothetical protein
MSRRPRRNLIWEVNDAMPFLFNSLLTQYVFDPANVILVRHQDQRATPGRTPYELWRDNRPVFERYVVLFRVQDVVQSGDVCRCVCSEIRGAPRGRHAMGVRRAACASVSAS